MPCQRIMSNFLRWTVGQDMSKGMDHTLLTSFKLLDAAPARAREI